MIDLCIYIDLYSDFSIACRAAPTEYSETAPLDSYWQSDGAVMADNGGSQ